MEGPSSTAQGALWIGFRGRGSRCRLEAFGLRRGSGFRIFEQLHLQILVAHPPPELNSQNNMKRRSGS